MDRNLYKSDKKLAERGWRAMRRTLDMEMPESRRRRPVALIWILALLLPIGGGLAWMFLGPTHPGSVPLTEGGPYAAVSHNNSTRALSDRSAKQSSTKSSSSSRPSTTNTRQPATSTPKSDPAKSSILAAAAPLAPFQLPLPTATSGTSNTNHTGIAGAETQPLDATGQVETVNAPGTANNPENTGNSIALDPVDIDPSPKTDLNKPFAAENTEQQTDVAASNATTRDQNADSAVQTPAPVAAVPTDAPPTNADPLGFAIDPFKSAAPQKWSLGASTGVLSDASASYAGATAGLSASWQPSRKWGVRSGLAYQYQTLPADERPVVSLSSATYVQNTGDIEIYTKTASTSAPAGFNTAAEAAEPVYIPVARLHRLELPLLAYYQPLSKLRLFGGVSVGTSVYAETGNRSLRNNTVFNLQSDKGDLNQEITHKVRGVDFHGGAGIGFLPFKRLELDLFYFHQLYAGGANNAKEASLLDNVNNGPGAPDPINSQAKPNSIAAPSLFQLMATWFF